MNLKKKQFCSFSIIPRNNLAIIVYKVCVFTHTQNSNIDNNKNNTKVEIKIDLLQRLSGNFTVIIETLAKKKKEVD